MLEYRQKLRAQIPYGYLKVIACRAEVTINSVSLFFKGKLNSQKIEIEALKLVAELKSEMQQLKQEAGIL